MMVSAHTCHRQRQTTVRVPRHDDANLRARSAGAQADTPCTSAAIQITKDALPQQHEWRRLGLVVQGRLCGGAQSNAARSGTHARARHVTVWRMHGGALYTPSLSNFLKMRIFCLARASFARADSCREQSGSATLSSVGAWQPRRAQSRTRAHINARTHARTHACTHARTNAWTHMDSDPCCSRADCGRWVRHDQIWA